jgi:4-hydroxy-4-methyl-2-oxoglutarate aldolase
VMGQLRNAKAAGFVSDGPVRDYDGVMETGVPVWCTGLHPNSPYGHGPGRVGGAAVVGGVRIASGDLIVADCNGVVVVPFGRLEAVAAKLAEVKRLEGDLESQVAEGFRTPLDLDAMLADGTAVAEG